MKLTKSKYTKGLQCAKALWLETRQPDLKKELSEPEIKRFATGTRVGELARQYYPGGHLVKAKDLEEALLETKALINTEENTLYEATAVHPENGCYARVDILHRPNENDPWHLIEVKSSSSVKDYHVDDIAFQYYVLKAAGYKILKCFIMHIDANYVRQGKIEIEQMFVLQDVISDVLQAQRNLDQHIKMISPVLKMEVLPEVEIGLQCGKPFDCAYKKHCWQEVPAYSVFNVFRKKEAFEVASKIDSYDAKLIPPRLYPKSAQKIVDLLSYKENRMQLEADEIQRFLNSLKYPLYYLDYETFNPAVPLFDNSRPYQQIPFQFSLHVQNEQNGPLQHFEFLHKEQTDPRKGFIEKLLEVCTIEGDIVVWNETFEKRINKELARDFPDYAEGLQILNNRTVDLMKPFQKRWIYKPEQCGSNSIKYVLPAFTDISYEGMEIANGGDASSLYEAFMTGGMERDEVNGLWPALSHYCELDTRAMAEIANVLHGIIS